MAVTAVMTVEVHFATLRKFTLANMRFFMIEVEVLLRNGLVRLVHIGDRLTYLSQNGNKHQNYES